MVRECFSIKVKYFILTHCWKKHLWKRGTRKAVESLQRTLWVRKSWGNQHHESRGWRMETRGWKDWGQSLKRSMCYSQEFGLWDICNHWNVLRHRIMLVNRKINWQQCKRWPGMEGENDLQKLGDSVAGASWVAQW